MAYEDFLNEVVRFLIEHPTEIIVVQVSPFETFCHPNVGHSTDRLSPFPLEIRFGSPRLAESDVDLLTYISFDGMASLGTVNDQVTSSRTNTFRLRCANFKSINNT